jgi:hypothetical protein
LTTSSHKQTGSSEAVMSWAIPNDMIVMHLSGEARAFTMPSKLMQVFAIIKENIDLQVDIRLRPIHEYEIVGIVRFAGEKVECRPAA